MTHNDTNDTGGVGNTRQPPRPKKVSIRGRKWCITLNNYTEEEFKNMTQVFSDCKYIFGKEVGENKTPHIQGYIELKNARTFKSIKKLIPRAHIEKAKGSTKQNFAYCSKDGDFISNIDFRTFKEKVKDRCLERYKGVVWKPWQKEVLELKNDERTINWFWDKKGNIGKTFLVKYLALTKNVILCEGKKNDIFNQVEESMKAEKLPEIVICDIPRTALDYINYGALEQLKNGMLYSGKYEGGQCFFPPPLVICMANEKPKLEALSEDRWNVVEIC